MTGSYSGGVSRRLHEGARERDSVDALAFFGCFTSWFANAQARFARAVGPISLDVTTGCVCVSTQTSGLLIAITQHGASLVVEVQGDCVDLLWSEDVAPRSTPGGWICALCSDVEAVTPAYPSLCELWRAHLFEAALTAFNDQLGTAHVLNVYSQTGATWVEASTRADPKATHVVAVQG